MDKKSMLPKMFKVFFKKPLLKSVNKRNQKSKIS